MSLICFIHWARSGSGEAGGVLDLVLDRLAQFQEKSIRTIKKVKSAMIYPSVIMFVAIGQ